MTNLFEENGAKLPNSRKIISNFFKNNPIALRHCLLYSFLQENSIENTFGVFYLIVGDNVIEKEEFEFRLDQFKRGIFYMDDGEGPITNMKEILRRDKYALRSCILYEILKLELAAGGSASLLLWDENKVPVSRFQLDPVFFIYQSFCEVIGDDVVEYKEFYFWYYRFANGEFDLNFERDKDKKIYELADMPIDVMNNVVEYLNIFDRSALARTSRSLKHFVEDHKIFYKKLDFFIDDRSAHISFGNGFIQTRRAPVPYPASRYHAVAQPPIQKEKYDCYRTYFGHNDVIYWKKALMDLKKTLKLPKLQLEEFHFRFGISQSLDRERDALRIYDEAADAVGAVLNSIRQLHVKHISLDRYYTRQILKILPSLKPQYLTTISICDSRTWFFDDLVEMEQWKQAKYFTADTVSSEALHHLYHFKKFNVTLEALSVESFRQMKEILFNSRDFIKCTVQVKDRAYRDAIRHELGDAIQGNRNTYHVPIPNSTKQKEIKDGKTGQLFSTAVDNKLREDLERMKEIRLHRGLRHYRGLRVRAQHTKEEGKISPIVRMS